MLKRIKAKILQFRKSLIYSPPPEREIDDIDINSIDLSKHKITLHKGDTFYRFAWKGDNPLKPTGRHSRYVSEPLGFDPEKVRLHGYNYPHTGGAYYGWDIFVACLEAGDLRKKDLFRITLLQDIEINDLDSICSSEGVKKPYMPKEWTDFTDKFYGTSMKGIRCESEKYHEGHIVVIYHDKFPEFENMVKVEKMEKDDIIEYLISRIRIMLQRGGNFLTTPSSLIDYDSPPIEIKEYLGIIEKFKKDNSEK